MKNCHFLLAQTLTSKQKAMPLFRNSSQHHSWYHLPKSELVCKFTSALTQSQPFFKLLEARKKIIICNRNLLLYLKNNGLNVEFWKCLEKSSNVFIFCCTAVFCLFVFASKKYRHSFSSSSSWHKDESPFAAYLSGMPQGLPLSAWFQPLFSKGSSSLTFVLSPITMGLIFKTANGELFSALLRKVITILVTAHNRLTWF